MLTEKELKFISQSERFITLLCQQYGVSTLYDFPDLTQRLTQPLEPVLIDDCRNLTEKEKKDLFDSYSSELGVAYFIVRDPYLSLDNRHVIFCLADQLSDALNLKFPLTHPLENHLEAIMRFGPSDGTLKVYDLVNRSGETGYREQGETSERFDIHNDGLGSGGTVQTVILYAESGPLFGGYTYFQNLALLSIQLAKQDYPAFQSLFLPDAITMIRPRGKGALRVKSPVLYLSETGMPKVMFRLPSGEYQVTLKPDNRELERAWEFLVTYTRPFANNSTFIHMTERGHGCLINNHVVVHGRTHFQDCDKFNKKRVLSRKWFMESERDATYKHVPGIFILQEYAQLYPELFGKDVLEGEWLFDQKNKKNNWVR